MKKKTLIVLISTIIIACSSLIVSAFNYNKSNLQLKISPKHAENMIRLDWTDMKENTYKVYQKKPGSKEFQTISTTDLDKSKQVRVLNIHPDMGNNISFTTWDGENLKLKQSASLKKWMEEPNPENPKGFGKGLIEVTPVSLVDFNSNPTKYLKKYNNDWDYDVIIFGTWDSNGSKDLNSTALPIVKDFILDGKGVLLGHDTLRQGTFPVFNELRSFVNIETPGDKNINNSYQNVKYAVVSEDVLKKKEGLLTNYPWVIDKSQLKVPITHTSRQWAYGDVWFDFTNINSTIYPGYEGIIYNGLDGKGTNNFYLTTWNNLAMIQTGHSSGQATTDEQKILANTLFYLNQLSTDNFLDDRSGQDVTAPNKPTIETHTISEGTLSFKLIKGQDDGSNYEYYVEAEGKDGSKITSNTSSTTITSGFKGYSYVIDDKPNTTPDDTIETKDSVIKGHIKGTETYLHVKAIDNVGNASEILHYKIEDKEKPILTITGNPTEWTNNDVLLNVDASDNISGLKEIILPNGTKINNKETVFKVSQNESLKFEAIDYAGNKETVNINVNKIDKTNPNITTVKEINPNKKEGFINININDVGSGIKELILPNGDIVKNINTYKYPIKTNGKYLFTVVDKVNNKSVVSVDISELQKVSSSGISKIEYKLHGATIKDWTTYNEPFFITNEGITYITARSYDKAGNISLETVSEVKIDKTKPHNNSIKIELVK